MDQSDKSRLLNGDEIKVMEMLGFMFVNQGMLSQAIKTVNALNVIDPTNSWAAFTKVVLFFMKEDYEKVIALSDRLLQRSPKKYNHTELKKLKARALFRLDRKKEATAIMREIMAQSSDNN